MFANTTANASNYTVIFERISLDQAASPRSLADLLGCVLEKNGISPISLAANRIEERKTEQPLDYSRKMR